MDKPTVQDVFEKFYPAYLERYPPSAVQAKTARNIINVKPERMGQISASVKTAEPSTSIIIPAGTVVVPCVRLSQKKCGWIPEGKMSLIT